MVLQTYYHNLDNTYNKLQTINEYMDDVEVRGHLLLYACSTTTSCTAVSALE